MSAQSIQAPPPAGPPETATPQHDLGALLRSLVQRIQAFASESAWLPLAGRVAMAAGAFVVLALVGSGAAMDRLPKSAAQYLGPPAASAEIQPTSAGDAGVAAVAQPAEPSHGSAAPAASHNGPAPPSDAGAPIADAATGSATPAPAGAITADGKVILNLATEEDLRKLPGIGPSKARAILALRQKLKRFRRVEDLLRVKGIGRKSLRRLRPRLLVDPPPP